MAAAVTKAGFKWPWRNNRDGIWPRLFVTAAGLVVGAIVAGAAHSQISGAYPALLVGIGAPAVIRGALSGIEIEMKEPEEATPMIQGGTDRADAV
jgi:uncharacterized membrane protein YfcA